jgi:hypothetical protein
MIYTLFFLAHFVSSRCGCRRCGCVPNRREPHAGYEDSLPPWITSVRRTIRLLGTPTFCIATNTAQGLSLRAVMLFGNIVSVEGLRQKFQRRPPARCTAAKPSLTQVSHVRNMKNLCRVPQLVYYRGTHITYPLSKLESSDLPTKNLTFDNTADQGKDTVLLFRRQSALQRSLPLACVLCPLRSSSYPTLL